jgi:site-specific DNA-methyltransferase (adenine-specific)
MEMEFLMNNGNFYNCDCIEGAQKYLEDSSVDLIITDPPYGINGDKLHKHYHRKEKFVIDGYIEIPQEEYPEFTHKWIKEAERILKPGGSIYIVSGYTNLVHILNALKETELCEINHIIWKYNFGVYTRNKYVSSHYHILFYVKPGAPYIFNTCCRFGSDERFEDNRSKNYEDREDVWIINREYKPGKIKNRNELPKELLKKIIQYSSNEDDLVCDFFLGGFSTAQVAIGMNRRIVGFEKSKEIYEHHIRKIETIKIGDLLDGINTPSENKLANQNKKWTKDEKRLLFEKFNELRKHYKTKRETIDILSKEFGRGYFSILNVLNAFEKNQIGSITKFLLEYR